MGWHSSACFVCTVSSNALSSPIGQVLFPATCYRWGTGAQKSEVHCLKSHRSYGMGTASVSGRSPSTTQLWGQTSAPSPASALDALYLTSHTQLLHLSASLSICLDYFSTATRSPQFLLAITFLSFQMHFTCCLLLQGSPMHQPTVPRAELGDSCFVSLASCRWLHCTCCEGAFIFSHTVQQWYPTYHSITTACQHAGYLVIACWVVNITYKGSENKLDFADYMQTLLLPLLFLLPVLEKYENHSYLKGHTKTGHGVSCTSGS